VAKHRYSEVKHPDKFIETLAGVWKKIERYAIPASIAAVVIVVGIGIWILLARHYATVLERPWEERFEIMSEMIAHRGEPEGQETYLGKLAEFASRHRGKPVEAVTLLEVAEGYLGVAARKRLSDAEAAQRLLRKAAEAAEQFIADFPDHRHVALAHYQAACAYLDLGDLEKAAKHFEHAAASPIRYLATLARLHLANCRQRLGDYDEARRLYQALRDDPNAGWCGDQARFQLAQLAARASKPQEAEESPSGAAQEPQ